MELIGTVCCIIYYTISSIKEIPSIVRVLRRKKSLDYSVPGVVMNLISTVAWSIYIYTSKQNMIVYVGTFTDLVICVIYTVAMLKYHNNENNGGQE